EEEEEAGEREEEEKKKKEEEEGVVEEEAVEKEEEEREREVKEAEGRLAEWEGRPVATPPLAQPQQGCPLTCDVMHSTPASPPAPLRVPGSPLPVFPSQSETPCQSPRTNLDDSPFPDQDDPYHLSPGPHCIMGSPPSPAYPPIIGAEDDYFDSQQEQINGQCSCFQSMESLKSRPAHLAAFLHHVVSQFDPTPLLCYLYADLHQQTSSKESRRIFTD
ncbi:hypothetical protein CRUP_010855, partial [Coryphaenoides rupestris]